MLEKLPFSLCSGNRGVVISAMARGCVKKLTFFAFVFPKIIIFQKKMKEILLILVKTMDRMVSGR